MFLRRQRARVAPTTAELYARWADCEAWACVYCGAPWEQVEHFIPLARGGADEVWNLWPSCELCNREKSDRHPGEWLQSRGVPVR
jgi:5-methylcytosine-specific restriction endonuclease McrA